jgi:Na+-driven multidrug efflux pump
MGVRGAALATVMSQAVSCIWVVLSLVGKRTVLRLRAKNLVIRVRYLLPCIALGLAPFIMQASESVITVAFNSSLLKYGGDIAVGAMTIFASVMQLALMPLQGLAQGAQPITGYNLGARNPERIKRVFRILLLTSLGYSLSVWGGIMLFPTAFASIFTSDAEMISFAASYLRIYCGALGIFGAQIACQMTFVSLGKAVSSMIVGKRFLMPMGDTPPRT